METINPINTQALIQLNRARKNLTQQQFKTLRGQVLSGNCGAALRGLKKLTERREAQKWKS